MARKVQDLYREALALSDEERAQLVRLLTEQRESFWTTPEVERAWLEEIERRERAIESGEEKLIPGEEVMRDLRRMLDE